MDIYYIIFTLLIILIVILYFIQNMMVYPGSLIKDIHDPEIHKKLEILDIDGHKSYYIRPKNNIPVRKLWIFFTGNNMIAKSYYKIAKKIQKYHRKDIMLLFEYPTFGINHNEGVLSLHTINDLIHKHVDHLKKEYNFVHINLFAWSLGCAIALNYANNNKDINNIYLLAPFTSFQEAIVHVLKGIPLHHLLRYCSRWDNLKTVIGLRAKSITIFHGTLDKTVPYDQGIKLFNNVPKKIKKRFVTFEGASHNIFKLIDYTQL